MAIDRRFGSTGALWSVVPRQRMLFANSPDERVYTGGAAVGLDVTAHNPTVVVWGWTPRPFNSLTQVLTIFFPADGRPMQEDLFDGTLILPVSDPSAFATPLATCGAPGGTAVLMRLQDAVRNPRFVAPRFAIQVAYRTGSSAGVLPEIAISPTWLFDPERAPETGSVRIVPLGPDFVVVSTSARNLRIARIPLNGAGVLATPKSLGGPGSALPGLTRLDIASIRVDGNWLSLALTAYLNLPGTGPVSVGAVLRVSPAGIPDTSYGDNGLWVSPLTNELTQFVCAGESAGGIAGIQGDEVVAFGIAPGGAGLDVTFGEGGVFRRSLGGVLSSPLATSDGQATCVFARRLGGSIVGCRFNAQGSSDANFGEAGLATVASDGVAAIPADIKVNAGRIFLALTRQVEGVECDRVPAIAVLDFNSGQPDVAFGAGGFAFHSAIGGPAVICPDGSALYAERKSALLSAAKNLRRADSAGRFERVVPVVPDTAPDRSIVSLWALADGSVLVGGNGNPAWIEKLTPAGVPDTSFGVNGIAIPRPGMGGSIQVLGTRTDGRIAIQFNPGAGTASTLASVGLLDSQGAVDTTYAQANGNFLEVQSFTHLGPTFRSSRQFLDADGSIICAASSDKPTSQSSFVQFALRRITPTGAYDANFGLGVPSVNPPATNRTIVFDFPAGGSSGVGSYSGMAAIGFSWMGGLLYVVAQGVAGGMLPNLGNRLPSYGVLVAMRWNADGTKDTTFDGGYQEAGFQPQQLDFRPTGVLPLSPTQLLVYDEAGHAETVLSQIGTQINTNILVRRPEPAVFSVSHPGGIDMNFGQDGADWLPMQEFETRTLHARLFPWRRGTSRVRFVCADFRFPPLPTSRIQSNFGGIGEFIV